MPTFPRRAVLGASIAVATSGTLAGCGRHPSGAPGAPSGAAGFVSPTGPQVMAAERRRGENGPLRRVRLTATECVADLGGPRVRTWTYGGELPGPEIRVTAGDVLETSVANHLPQSTTVHWHGCAIRNDMDGVPGLTQRPIPSGGDFSYRFTLATPGTYWYHPHTGVQQDRGLYAPLIVEDPREPLNYDQEWVVVLDDWLDGVDGSTPDVVLAQLQRYGGQERAAVRPADGRPVPDGGGGGDGDDDGMGGMGAPAADPSVGPDRRLTEGDSDLLGGHAGDVDYPYYLINGRVPTAPQTFTARPGERIRIRIINAGGDTAFRIALGGHRMRVTHADGRPVEQATTDALLLGMGERYDVLVTAGDGAFPLVAMAEGKGAHALAVLRTSPSAGAPSAYIRPRELYGTLLTADRLRADPSVRPDDRDPDDVITLRMSRDRDGYAWLINGEPYSPSERIPVRSGQRVRLSMFNQTRMWHPMHLHGHTFALPDGGPLKDTAILLPRQRLDVDMDADNPGLWMLHCHNIYHAESGMMTVLGYRS